MNWLIFILYGFVGGLGQLLPVSADAHDYFLRLMTRFEPNQPMLQLCIHMASLAAVLFLCRHRCAHVYREMRIDRQSPRLRKRQPDMVAVLDGKVVRMLFVPVAIGLLLTNYVQARCSGLPMVITLLILSGVLIYLPHFLPGANRDSRHLSPLETLIFGVFGGLSAFCGVSRLGNLLSVGALRGCSRSYMLDIAYLLMIPVLALLVMLDLVALLSGGLAIMTWLYFLQCLLAGAAAFGGACFAIAAMRFVSVNMGYTVFAYYNWGLGIF